MVYFSNNIDILSKLTKTELNKSKPYQIRMVDQQIDMTQYLEVMDLTESFLKKEIPLSENDYLRLQEYELIFQYEIYFSQREKYVQLIEQYLKNNDKFAAESFCIVFKAMVREDGYKIDSFGRELWKNRVLLLKTNSKAKKFYELIELIMSWLECLSLTPGKSAIITQEKLKEEIEKTFRETQYFLNQKNSWSFRYNSWKIVSYLTVSYLVIRCLFQIKNASFL